MQKAAASPAVQACCIAAYSWSFFVFGLQINLLGPTASIVAANCGVVAADLGIIFTVNGFMSILGGLPSGWLIDRLPGHAVLAVALLFEAVGYVFIPYARSLLSLAVAFGSVALSWNVINTAGNTYILWLGNAHQKPEAQGVLINMVNALFGAGSLAAPLVAELCARLRHPMSAFWITAALTALSAASFLVLPSPQPPSSSSGNSSREAEDGGASLQQPLLPDGPAAADAAAPAVEWQQQECANRHAAAVSEAAAASPGSKPRAAAASGSDGSEDSSDDGSGWSHWWRGGPLTGLLLIICVFNYLNVGTEVAFGAWIFTYSLNKGLSEQQGHFLNAAYWAAFTCGRVVASFAAALLRPSTLLFASLPLALAGAAAALLLPAGSLTGAGGVWLLLLVSVLIGLGVSAGFANSLALLDNYHPCTGSVTGLLGGVAGAGCMTIPLLIGVLAKFSVVGYQGLMITCACSFVGQLLCVPAALAVGEAWARRQGGPVTDAESVTQFVMDGGRHNGEQQQTRPQQQLLDS